MNETEAQTYISEIASRVPVGPPRINSLGARARAIRRRNLGIVAAGVFLAAIPVATVVGLSQQRPNEHVVDEAGPANAATSSPTATTSTDQPTTEPSQLRKVGIGRAVVSVPSAWPIISDDCTAPKDGNYVFWYSDSRATATCYSWDTPPGVTVGISTLESTAAKQALFYLSNADLKSDIVGSQPRCSQAGNYCVQWIGVQSQDAFFSLTASQPDATEAIAAVAQSLQVLESGQTTVPFISQDASLAEARAELERAGLGLATTARDMPSSIRATDPGMATQLPRGSQVRLLE